MAKVTNETVNKLNSTVSKNTSAVDKSTNASKKSASSSDKNTSAANKLDNTIKANTKASNANANTIDKAADSIEKSVGILKDEGINLTESIDNVKKEIQELPEKWQELLQTVMEMNNKILDLNESKPEIPEGGTDNPKKEEDEEKESENPLEKEFEKLSFDTSGTDISILTSANNLPNMMGAGLALIHNSLQQVVGAITDGFSQMTSLLVGNLNKVNNSEEAKNTEAGENQVTPLKSSIAEFFNGLAGPMQSIASALLLVSLAAAVLNAIPLESMTVTVTMQLFTFLTATFTALSLISLGYQKVAHIVDPEQQDNPANLMNMVNQLSKMMLSIGAMVAVSVAIVTVLKSNMSYVMAGLAMSFGTMALSLISISLLSEMALPEVQEGSKPNQLMQDFNKMLLTTSAIFLVNALLFPIIREGAIASMVIMGVMSFAIIKMMESVKELAETDPEVLEQLNGLFTRITVLFGIMGAMVVILGLLPLNVVIQGTITVIAMTGLVAGLVYMLTTSAKKLDSLKPDTLEQLNTMIIASTVMIGLLGLLVIVLGLMPLTAVIQGIVAVTVIAALPITLIKIFAKVAQQSSQLVQALEGIVIATLVSVATAGLAWLLITILGGFTIQQVLTTMAAMGLMVALSLVVTGAIVVLGLVYAALVSGPQASLIPMAFMGIIIAGTFSVAVAAFAKLISLIFSSEDEAIKAQQAAKAVMLTAIALTTVAVSIVTIGALAIPMMIAMPLALIALEGLTRFINTLNAPEGILAMLAASGQMDLSGVYAQVANISSLCIALATLNIPLAVLALNAPLLLISLSICTTSMFMIGASLVLLSGSLRVIQALTFVDVSPKITELSNAIQSLNNLAQVVGNFTGMDIAKVLMVKAALGYVASFEKSLGRIGNNAATENIVNLTNNLSNLANTAPGLNALAEAITRVSVATASLNQVQNSNAQSIERLTGQAASRNEFLSNPSLRQESSNKSNSSNFEPILDALNKVVSRLEDLKNSQDANNSRLNSLIVTMDGIGQRMSLNI